MTQTNKRFLIKYENSHWCGGQLAVVVWAQNEEEARDAAGPFMDETQFELFSNQYEEEPDNDDGCYASVNSVEEFDHVHAEWKYFVNKNQEQFYPIIGMPYGK